MPGLQESVDANLDDGVEAVRDASPAASEAEDRDDMPLPTEPRTFFLGGLFLLALLAALYVAAPLVLPVVLAIVLKLLLQPLVRLSDRLGVPHGLSAVLAILLLTLSLAALASGVAGPPRLGRQAAGGAAADPAAARLPCPSDRYAGMDDGPVAGLPAAARTRRRDRRCTRPT